MRSKPELIAVELDIEIREARETDGPWIVDRREHRHVIHESKRVVPAPFSCDPTNHFFDLIRLISCTRRPVGESVKVQSVSVLVKPPQSRQETVVTGIESPAICAGYS